MRIFTFIILTIITLNTSSVAETFYKNDLDLTIQTAIQESQMFPDTGVAVLVIKDDQVILKKGYGLRDRALKLSVTPQTTFAIASLTKAMTAYSAAILVERGKLNWDLPVKTYLPWFKMKDPEADRLIAPVDLMSHRTGVFRHDFFWILSGLSIHEIAKRIQFLETHPDPSRFFRKGMLYNNIMYGAAGLVLEQASGTSWKNFIRNELFKPLEMHQTFLTTAEFLRAPERAIGYYKDGQTLVLDMDQLPAAGAVSTHLDDLELWLKFQLNNGVLPNGDRLISESNHANLLQPKIHHPDQTMPISYGLGWFIEQPKGASPLYYHDGSTLGYTSMISFFPEKKLGVVVLSNQWGGTVASHVAKSVLKYFSIDRMTKTNTLSNFASDRTFFNTDPSGISPFVFESLNLSHKNFLSRASSSSAINNIAGLYYHRAYGLIELQIKDEKYFVKYFQHHWSLYPTQNTNEFQFLVEWGAGGFAPFTLKTYSDSSSQVTHIEIPFEPSLAQLGQWIRFDRL